MSELPAALTFEAFDFGGPQEFPGFVKPGFKGQAGGEHVDGIIQIAALHGHKTTIEQILDLLWNLFKSHFSHGPYPLCN